MLKRSIRLGQLAALPLCFALWIGGCNPVDSLKTVDKTAPAAVTNLVVDAGATATSLALTWTAPGDDGATGTASQYDIRYSTAQITDANFGDASKVDGAPAPAVGGTPQNLTVTTLLANTRYYFALKTADEVPNWSGLSNVPDRRTAVVLLDTVAPAPVTLAAGATTATSVTLTWSAPGDDGVSGTASQYDIRYSTALISEANFSSATSVNAPPAPSAPTTLQTVTVANLALNTVYYFAMKTADEVPNWSALSNVLEARTASTQTVPPLSNPLDFPITSMVCFTSNDQFALVAKNQVQARLAMINAYSQTAAALLAPLDHAQWQQNGDCWDWTVSILTCTSHYSVCLVDGKYTYTLTRNGQCFPQAYSNWVAFRAEVDPVNRTGTFRVYAENTTTVQMAWVWSWVEDENAGTFTFYQGEPPSAPILGVLTWTKSADDNVYDMTWTSADQDKWVGHFERSPCSGQVRTYQWSSANNDWWMNNDIVWNQDGTGYWDVYDDTGTRTEHHLW